MLNLEELQHVLYYSEAYSVCFRVYLKLACCQAIPLLAPLLVNLSNQRHLSHQEIMAMPLGSVYFFNSLTPSQ